MIRALPGAISVVLGQSGAKNIGRELVISQKFKSFSSNCTGSLYSKIFFKAGHWLTKIIVLPLIFSELDFEELMEHHKAGILNTYST